MTRWDAARQASQRTTRKYKPCGPVGPSLLLLCPDIKAAPGGRLDDRGACGGCGYHVCSCPALVQPPYGKTHEGVEISYQSYFKPGIASYQRTTGQLFCGLLTQKQLDDVREFSDKLGPPLKVPPCPTCMGDVLSHTFSCPTAQKIGQELRCTPKQAEALRRPYPPTLLTPEDRARMFDRVRADRIARMHLDAHRDALDRALMREVTYPPKETT